MLTHLIPKILYIIKFLLQQGRSGTMGKLVICLLKRRLANTIENDALKYL